MGLNCLGRWPPGRYRRYPWQCRRHHSSPPACRTLASGRQCQSRAPPRHTTRPGSLYFVYPHLQHSNSRRLGSSWPAVQASATTADLGWPLLSAWRSPLGLASASTSWRPSQSRCVWRLQRVLASELPSRSAWSLAYQSVGVEAYLSALAWTSMLVSWSQSVSRFWLRSECTLVSMCWLTLRLALASACRLASRWTSVWVSW